MDDAELSELLRDLVRAAVTIADNVEIIAETVNPELHKRVIELYGEDDE